MASEEGYSLSPDEAAAIGRTILQQIGTGNVLAISGGRRYITPTGGVVFPVSNGYRVSVALDRASDTYIVRRMFVRGMKAWIKGTQENVYCDEVGEVAYQASCFHNGPWGVQS